MRYFELRDDMLIPNRWHLDEVVTESGEEPRLRAGLPFAANDRHLRVEMTQIGRALDYCLTSFAVPIVRAELGKTIAEIAGSDVQMIPVEVPGHQEFHVLNALRVLKCLDEGRSEFTKWTTDDHRADLAGQYRMVTELKVLSEQVPADSNLFRIEGWLIALVVSEKVKNAMERAGCLGAKFVEVT